MGKEIVLRSTNVGYTDVLMMNRYAILDPEPVRNYTVYDSDFKDVRRNRKKKNYKKMNESGPAEPTMDQGNIKVSALKECVGSALNKKNRISDPMDIKKKVAKPSSVGPKKMKNEYDATLDNSVKKIMKATKGIDLHGFPINKQVLKNYIQQVEESEGFDIRDFPGHIVGVTSILPSQNVLDNPKSSPEEYKKIMYLAALSVAVYNKKHGTYFKLGKIEKSNFMMCGRMLNYYITFTGVEVIKGSILPNILRMLVIGFKWIMMLLFILFWCLLTPQLDQKKELKLKMERYLEYYRASEGDLSDESANHKTFQALVTDNIRDVEQKVKFCRDCQMLT